MKLGFCLFRYFPYGGLQRNLKDIAMACVAAGDEVFVYTMDWQGERPAGLTIRLITVRALTNHARCEQYVHRATTQIARDKIDCVIGFNRMPGLDIYFGSDRSYKARGHGFLRRLTARYRLYTRYEQAVFDPRGHTHILALAERQKQEYRHAWRTPEERFTLLPPGIARPVYAATEAAAQRKKIRAEFAVADEHFMLVLVGSGFKTKGLSRALRAVAALPPRLKNRTRFFAIGQDKAAPFTRLIKKLSLERHAAILPARDDIPAVLEAADALLHPAYRENTGTVILEAIVAGLPVIATEVCGFAHHVRKADAGVISPSPFDQRTFNRQLRDMLVSTRRPQWRENGIRYGQTQNLYAMVEQAVAVIAARCRQKGAA